jgi:hypothetical protein
MGASVTLIWGEPIPLSVRCCLNSAAISRHTDGEVGVSVGAGRLHGGGGRCPGGGAATAPPRSPLPLIHSDSEIDERDCESDGVPDKQYIFSRCKEMSSILSRTRSVAHILGRSSVNYHVFGSFNKF